MKHSDRTIEKYRNADLPDFIINALAISVKQFSFENSLLKGYEVEELAFFANELACSIQSAMIDFFVNKKDTSDSDLSALRFSEKFVYSHFPNYIKVAMCNNLEKMVNTNLYNEEKIELMSSFSEMVVFNMEIAQIENRKSKSS